MTTDKKPLADVKPSLHPVVKLRDWLPPLPFTHYNACGDGSEPLYTAGQMRDYARAALSAQPHPPSSFDLEAMLAACVPGGDIADPQVIADNIRHWFAAQPSPGGQDAHQMADALERIAAGSLSDYEGVEADELHILRCAKLIRDLAARPSPGGQVALPAQAVWMLPDDARLVGVIADNIERGKLDHPGFYRNTQLADALRRVLGAALSAQPSPVDQDALVTALEVFERRRADIPYEVYEQVKAVCAVLAARRPVGEHAEGDEFLAGVCVALQCVTAQDSGVLWAEIVRAVGVDDLLQYATFIEPAEWDLAGFSTYASTELNRRRPRSKAAKQAKRPSLQAVHHQAALLAEERAHGNTIDQRDRCEEVADELSARIASITGVDIGEHSSANCPWQNAIEAAEAYQPAQAVDPDELRRAVSVVNVVGRVDGHDVVRRDSVLDVIDTRRQRLTDSKVVGNG